MDVLSLRPWVRVGAFHHYVRRWYALRLLIVEFVSICLCDLLLWRVDVCTADLGHSLKAPSPLTARSHKRYLLCRLFSRRSIHRVREWRQASKIVERKSLLPCLRPRRSACRIHSTALLAIIWLLGLGETARQLPLLHHLKLSGRICREIEALQKRVEICTSACGVGPKIYMLFKCDGGSAPERAWWDQTCVDSKFSVHVLESRFVPDSSLLRSWRGRVSKHSETMMGLRMASPL